MNNLFLSNLTETNFQIDALSLLFETACFISYKVESQFENPFLNEHEIDSKLHVDRRPLGLWIVCDCLSKTKALVSILSNLRAFMSSVLIVISFLKSISPDLEKSQKSLIWQESASNNELDLRIACFRLLIGRHWNRNPLWKFSETEINASSSELSLETRSPGPGLSGRKLPHDRQIFAFGLLEHSWKLFLLLTLKSVLKISSIFLPNVGCQNPVSFSWRPPHSFSVSYPFNFRTT